MHAARSAYHQLCVTTSGLVLDRNRTAVRAPQTRTRAAPALARERLVEQRATVALTVRLARLVRRAYFSSVALLILAFPAVLLLDGGWQAAAGGFALTAGVGALVAFVVLATLADQV